jgi:hypothetical protein
MQASHQLITATSCFRSANVREIAVGPNVPRPVSSTTLCAARQRRMRPMTVRKVFSTACQRTCEQRLGFAFLGEPLDGTRRGCVDGFEQAHFDGAVHHDRLNQLRPVSFTPSGLTVIPGKRPARRNYRGARDPASACAPPRASPHASPHSPGSRPAAASAFASTVLMRQPCRIAMLSKSIWDLNYWDNKCLFREQKNQNWEAR